MVQFATLKYMPVLIFRRAEVKAVDKLYGPQKDLLFPLFRIRPWGRKDLDKTFEKARAIMGHRNFACDFDDYYNPDSSTSNAAAQYKKLTKAKDLNPWYNKLLAYDEIVPCIRLDPDLSQIVASANRPDIVERGFGLVIRLDQSQLILKLLEVLDQIAHNNFFVMIDSGWSRDVLGQASAASALAASIINKKPETTVFLSSTSFPKSFSKVGVNSTVPLPEFNLVDSVNAQLAQTTNLGAVKYSDWATTRPPGGAGGGDWIPRIDVPEIDKVRMYRDRIKATESSAQTCQRLAAFAVSNSNWPSPPPSWGHYSIDLTASGGEHGIYSAQANSATRINIHLHNVLSAGEAGPPATGEEPFEG